MNTITPLFSYRKYWAKRFGTATFLPMSRTEMEQLGWDSCDIIIVTGDAYVDHPSFGMAIIGRLLESQGFRVGIISQPAWHNCDAFKVLGKPNLFFGVTSGNMDSMVNHYTADRKIRSDDAYTPNGEPNKRPNRAVIVYAQRCREAYPDAPIVLGGIEASLRRFAHYDYWADQVRRSILIDSKADILAYGNAERAIVAIAQRLGKRETIADLIYERGTVSVIKSLPADWLAIDASSFDAPPPPSQSTAVGSDQTTALHTSTADASDSATINNSSPAIFVRLPSFEQVKNNKLSFAHASRLQHLETNPDNARVLAQGHGDRYVWANPPAIPLTTTELDAVYDLPYSRLPHPAYGNAKIPAYEMIRFSINILRGCFGGCTFCSLTSCEGRTIQNRSEASVLREIENIRDKTPGFTGIISDLGGPTANMYRLQCTNAASHKQCRRLSCVYPDICKNMSTNHQFLINLYRQARAIPGVKKILIGSGVRYDLAIKSPDYIRELASFHVGGYLKIAPEHICEGPLQKMMKPNINSYYEFKKLFDRFSHAVNREQYLIPYFIASHPGTTDEDMLELALWLKANDFRLDKVQNFIPTPMTLATTMYYTARNPLAKIAHDSEKVFVPKAGITRRIHKAFLRYHDPANWPLLRQTLKRMGRTDLIGNGKKHLVPNWQPKTISR
jgi:uncharacterized radical SAM protein YgiQ